MAKTRADLAAKIADDLARGDLTTQIDDAIEFSIRRYERERFWFNDQDNISVTLSSSVSQLALSDLPVKVFQIDRVRILLSSNTLLDLYPRDRNWIAARQDINLSSMPVEYCVYDEALQFDSLADQNYTLVLDGVVGLGNTTASNSYSAASPAIWFNEARDLIRADAKRDLYANVIKDFEFAARMNEVAQYEYSQLKARTNRIRMTGQVRPTRF